MSQTNRKMRALQKSKQEDQDRRIAEAVERERANPTGRNHKRNLAILGICLLILLAVAGVKFLINSYPADDAAIAAAETTKQGATITPSGAIVTDLGNGKLCFAPDEHSTEDHPGMEGTGLIFYPGGQIERDAFAPLCTQLAKQGITVVLEEVPFNLAILEPNTADGTRELLPDIENWYIGGHSLGGLCAGTYVSNHPGEFKGLILLTSYLSDDLSGMSDLSVLSIYGSEDGILNMESYEEAKSLLPESFEEHVIKGGNHYQFGNYGEQSGDNDATISREEQQAETAQLVADFMRKHNGNA